MGLTCIYPLGGDLCAEVALSTLSDIESASVGLNTVN